MSVHFTNLQMLKNIAQMSPNQTVITLMFLYSFQQTMKRRFFVRIHQRGISEWFDLTPRINAVRAFILRYLEREQYIVKYLLRSGKSFNKI